jgi:RNA polymerase sigma factor (sigma-70 family)
VTEILDDDAVRRAAAGDVDAFAALVGRHRAVALRVAYGIASDAAEDVVQDACVKAFRALARFDTTQPFRPWLLAIVTNEARNWLRGDGRHRRAGLRLAAHRGTDGADPAEATERGEARRRLLGAVARLSPADRELVVLRWFAELSEAETATALGCPVGTVKSRSSRVLGKLRALLSEEVRADA